MCYFCLCTGYIEFIIVPSPAILNTPRPPFIFTAPSMNILGICVSISKRKTSSKKCDLTSLKRVFDKPTAVVFDRMTSACISLELNTALPYS